MGKMSDLLEFELNQVRWNEYREISGDATDICSALARFVYSTSTEEVNTAYWGLENHVVADGVVYSAAEPAISVLMAGFATPPITQIKICSLEFNYQIPHGLPP